MAMPGVNKPSDREKDSIVNVYMTSGVVKSASGVEQMHHRTLIHVAPNKLYELRTRPAQVQGQDVQEYFWFQLPALPLDSTTDKNVM